MTLHHVPWEKVLLTEITIVIMILLVKVLYGNAVKLPETFNLAPFSCFSILFILFYYTAGNALYYC